jgi:hypothetical protein
VRLREERTVTPEEMDELRAYEVVAQGEREARDRRAALMGIDPKYLDELEAERNELLSDFATALHGQRRDAVAAAKRLSARIVDRAIRLADMREVMARAAALDMAPVFMRRRGDEP